MSKEIRFEKDARSKLVKGIDTLADAVVSTLGPNGRNVVISQGKLGNPRSTKDGVSVAKEIELEDPTENLGVQLIKQASVQTANKAGDGTTTSTLLAREMIKNGLTALDNKENAVEIKRDMEIAAQEVISFLKENVVEDISNQKQLEQVATISANNDEKAGKLIATAIERVGVDGIVHIEKSNTGETFLENVEGIQFDRGYKSPYLVTNNDTMSAVLENPLILISDSKFTGAKDLVPAMSEAQAQGRALLVIADDIEGQCLATVIVNKMRTGLRICVVKAPDFGDRKKLILEDIAIATGGTVFSPAKGMKMDRFSREWFGNARTVTVEKDKTTIVDGEGKTEDIQARAEELSAQISSPQATQFEIEKLQERLSNFSGGVSIIHVGGNTETEIEETTDRIDDALHATKAAIQEGLVPGGGIALLYASQTITGNSTGANIVRTACRKPFRQILVNAGYDDIQAQLLANKLIDSGDDYWAGYNIKTDEIVNMKEAGILDPTKVTRNALENAISVAGSVLLTECTIVDIPSENEGGMGIDPSMLGMM